MFVCLTKKKSQLNRIKWKSIYISMYLQGLSLSYLNAYLHIWFLVELEDSVCYLDAYAPIRIWFLFELEDIVCYLNTCIHVPLIWFGYTTLLWFLQWAMFWRDCILSELNATQAKANLAAKVVPVKCGAINPLMPVGNYSYQFFICCPRDCVSRTANVEGTARH